MHRKIFLIKYYIYNVIFIKFFSRIKYFLSKRRVKKLWDEIYNKYSIRFSSDVLVVGNGPSLKLSDLESLSYLPSIASNKIDLIFNETSWRPDLVTICDPLLAFKLRNHDFDGVNNLLCSNRIWPFFSNLGLRVTPWKNVKFLAALSVYKREKNLPISPLEGFFEGYTVTVQNIQLAIWLGAKRIFITGCDHFYSEKQNSKHGKKLSHMGVNHFHKDYRKPGEIVNNAPIELMNAGYEIVNYFAKKNNVEIINISRNSYLDVFPKLDFEEAVTLTNVID